MRWAVYILRCADDTLYTGIASDVEKRIAQHASGKGARYTRGRGPFTVLYVEACDTRGEALKREAKIKSLPRRGKLQLIRASKLS